MADGGVRRDCAAPVVDSSFGKNIEWGRGEKALVWTGLYGRAVPDLPLSSVRPPSPQPPLNPLNPQSNSSQNLSLLNNHKYPHL